MKSYIPFTYLDTLTTGANKPILSRGIDEEGERQSVVVKLMDSERMNAGAALKETVGAILARRLGLNSPEPFIVNVTPEFIQSRVEQEGYMRLANSAGLNYGCKNIEGLELFRPNSNLGKKLKDEALKIFYFDMLIQNTDRTNSVGGKPNLFLIGKDFWLLDHELAFSFLVPLIGRPPSEPWEFTDFDNNMVGNHILYRHLKGKTLNFAILDSFLKPLDLEFWEDLREAIPNVWDTGDFNLIKNHINQIKENEEKFIEQIKNLLS